MPRYGARVEFRRATTSSRWVIAGVSLAGRFWPALPDVEPVRARLPTPGLVGWAAIDTPIVAPDTETAAETALDLARTLWPDRARGSVPLPRRTPGRTDSDRRD